MAATSTSKPSTTAELLSISAELSQQILLTHNCSLHNHQVLDLQDLIKPIQIIFRNTAVATSDSEGVDHYGLHISDAMRQALQDISSVSCEISCNVSADGNNVDGTTMEVLRRLKNYSWNAKVVLAIAAFASSIGELLMFLKHRNTDPIAKSIDILRSTTPDLSLLQNIGLFKAMTDVANTNLAFMGTAISKIPIESASMEAAISCFPAATYRIIRIILQINASIFRKTVRYHDELKRFTNEVSGINTILEEKLELCKKEAGKPKLYIHALKSFGKKVKFR
ncbi:hypothetical protein PTKIN_Ptkin01aG0287800 [Pterospermum kingtungense]